MRKMKVEFLFNGNETSIEGATIVFFTEACQFRGMEYFKALDMWNYFARLCKDIQEENGFCSGFTWQSAGDIHPDFAAQNKASDLEYFASECAKIAAATGGKLTVKALEV
jgi:hypothetical protein